MKRRKLPNHRAQAQAHHQRTDAYVDALIEDLRRQSLDSALLLAELVHYDGTEELYFDHVPQIRQAVQRIRLTYADRLRLGIASAVRREWNIASKGQDDFVAKALNAYGLQDEDGKYYPKNEDALQAFTKRREQGLKLSERVWDLSGEHMQSLERAISTAVHEGWSAATLSKRVSQYLKDFPKLKQDYTERFGKAIDVQDCEYKSARLARTEINMAYREAERTRWQELDFVTGYEVKRSGREYDCEVCASLAGKYPKDFKWAGWHPNCRCYALPILSTEDEFWASFESDTPTPSSNEVTDVPENFKQWLAENADRHARSKARGTEPYFLRDNPKYTAGKSPTPKPEPSPTPSAPATPPKPSIAERARARHEARTPQQIAEIQKRWDDRALLRNKEALKEYRKDILAQAKENLLGKSVSIQELIQPITFTTKGLKEAINQPHKYYLAKNEALEDIIKRIQEGAYNGYKIDDKGRNLVFHYISTTIENEQSLIVLKEDISNGTLSFYTISEIRK